MVLIGVVALAAGSMGVDGAERRPNVVIIYGDDVGFGDVGAYGSTMILTSNIDRLAREGLRFADGYCSSATCLPPLRSCWILNSRTTRRATAGIRSPLFWVGIPSAFPT